MHHILSFTGYIVSYIPATLISSMAWALTFLFFDILKVRRKVVLNNITIAFSFELTEKEKIKLARRSYYEFCLTIFETLGSINPRVKKKIAIINREIADNIFKNNEGCYILCAHIGNWEYAASSFSEQVHKARVVVKKVGGKRLNSFVTYLRAKNNFQVIEKSPAGMAVRTIFETINKKGCVGVMLDQYKPGEPYLEFFNQKARTNTSLAAMVRRKPASILPVFIKRRSFNNHELIIAPPIDIIKSENSTDDILENSTRFNKEIEKMIRQNPSQ